jgi:hypothetical protein
MKTQFLKHQNKWTACITFKGYDYFELGDSEKEAIDKLNNTLSKISRA